jgi:hypothetical protein
VIAEVAVLLLLLGALVLLGTLEELAVAPLMRRDAVPACCRRRVSSFEAHARWILAGAGASVLCGAVLLLT